MRSTIWVEKSARLRNLIILVIFPKGLKLVQRPEGKFQSLRARRSFYLKIISLRIFYSDQIIGYFGMHFGLKP